MSALGIKARDLLQTHIDRLRDLEVLVPGSTDPFLATALGELVVRIEIAERYKPSRRERELERVYRRALAVIRRG